MQQTQSQKISALPPEQQQQTPPKNPSANDRVIPTFQTMQTIINNRTNTQYITTRKSKSKPKGLLLTQAAEIKKLNESLTQYKNKYMSLERERMDRESYENYIKELIESDNSKKNEIEKLSLTIRSLISSCEAYRQQIGTTNLKIRKVQDFNHDIMKKYDALDRQNQQLKKSFQDYKIDKEKQIESVNKEFALNQNYSQSLQRNVQELMKRVNQIPNLERDLRRVEDENIFWRNQTERLNNQLATMDQLYINAQRKNVELQAKYKTIEEKRMQLEADLKSTQTIVISLRSQISQLTEQAQSHEVALHSKNQAFQSRSQQVQQHKTQANLLASQLQEQQQQIKLKNKLILSLEKQITKLNEEQKGYEDFRKYYTTEMARISTQKDGDLSALNTIINQQREKENNLRFLLQQRERDTMAHKKKIQELEMQLIKVSSQLHFCEADKQILLKEVNKYRGKDQANEAAIVKLREELKAKTIDNQASSKRIEELSEQLNKQMTKGLELHSKLAKISEQSLKKDEKLLSLSSKVQVFQKATANLKSRLSSQTKALQQRLQSVSGQQSKKQLAIKQLQQKLQKLSAQNNSLKAQRQQLNQMIINKSGESQQIKKKMIIIENQLIEQFDTNINETNRYYQSNMQKLGKENQELSLKLQAQQDSHRKLDIYIQDDHDMLRYQTNINELEVKEDDYKERARRIEKKLIEYREVKREFEKLKKSLQKTVDQNERLKQEISKQELQSSTRLAKSQSLIEEKERIIAQRNQIAKMLENKTSQCQKLKRKLLEMEDQLRAFFQASIKTELRSHQQHIEKLEKEKVELEQSTKNNLKKAYEELEKESKQKQELLRTSSSQNERLKNQLGEYNSNYQEAVSKLMEELQRLQSILATTQQKQASDAASYSSKLQSVKEQLKNVEQQLQNQQKATKSLKITVQQYQAALSKLQEEFIALQLLVGELKQERGLFMKKNNFMIKGINSVREEMEKLDSSAEKISKLFDSKSSIHQDIGKHYEIIQGAFASLQKFRIVVESHQVVQTEKAQEKQTQ